MIEVPRRHLLRKHGVTARRKGILLQIMLIGMRDKITKDCLTRLWGRR
jgi:hypothetical protein